METNATIMEPGVADGSESVHRAPTPDEPLDPAALITEALDWIEKNQTLAMLGAFALGVFVGTLLRD